MTNDKYDVVIIDSGLIDDNNEDIFVQEFTKHSDSVFIMIYHPKEGPKRVKEYKRAYKILKANDCTAKPYSERDFAIILSQHANESA